MPAGAALNPFPGLRPFETGEEYLFFGREGQSEEILRRLRQNRFLAVIGTSGSGKSSLIRAGLLPYLYGGFMAGAGSHWRAAIFRPGNDPTASLARALDEQAVLGDRAANPEDAARNAILLEVTLRQSGLGLVEAVRLAQLPKHENVLIIVDQFEELFRFAKTARQEDAAAAFVKLLLEATRQNELPIYVVMTMRSDFIGDCARFRDLPEAVTNGLYLIPRMTREQLRSAIEGPARVGNAEVERRLVTRLLNDTGDDVGKLPTLQHALMRTWERWQDANANGRPVTLEHYLAVGGMSEALDRHAEEAYSELPSDRLRDVAKRVFQSLTEKGPDNRELRRPATVADIAGAAGATAGEVVDVIECFRRPGRSFLMPPSVVPLDADTMVDISHESLIRGWSRLRNWVDEEAESARIYRRLAEEAALHAQGKWGLRDGPQLNQALAWREEEKPTAGWANRYDPGFAQAMDFLDKSRESRNARLRQAKNRKAVMAAVAAAVMILIAAPLFVAARNQQMAQRSQAEARRNAAVTAQALEVAARERGLRAEADKANKAAQTAMGQANAQRRAAEDNAAAYKRAQEDAERLRRIAQVQADIATQQTLLARSASAEAARQARIALAARLASGARSLPADQFDLALLLALAGERLNGTLENRGSLYDLLLTHPRLAMFLYGNGKPVNSVAFSPNGAAIASGGDDGAVRVWNPGTGRQVRVLGPGSPKDAARPGHTGSVQSVAFSPDGRFLASGGSDHTVRLWNVATGLQVRVLGPGSTGNAGRPGHTDWVRSVAFSPDGRLLASGGDDKTVRIWDVATGEQLRVLGPGGAGQPGHTSWVHSVAFSRNGLLASGGNDNAIRLWDVATGQQIRVLGPGDPDDPGQPGHTDAVLSLAFNPDGTLLASGGGREDKTIWLWSVATGKPVREPLKGHEWAVFGLAFSPDGKVLASGSADHTILLWDVATGKSLSRHTSTIATVYGLAFSPDGKTLASGTEDGLVVLWDAATPERLERRLSDATVRGDVLSVAFDPTGRILASGGEDNAVHLWDVATGKQLRELGPGDPKDPRRPGHTDSVSSLAFSPNGRLLASGGEDNTVRLWNVATGQQVHVLGPGDADDPTRPGHTDLVLSVAFSPNGRLLASSGGDADKTIRIWDVATGGQLHVLGTPHTAAVTSVAFSPNGRLLASAGGDDQTIVLWDVATWKPFGPPVQSGLHAVFSLTFSEDGTLLAEGGDHADRLWHVTPQGLVQPTKLWNHNDSVFSVALSPDDRLLAAEGADGLMHLWNTAIGLPMGPPLSLKRGLTDSLVFSRDGRLLASTDGTDVVLLDLSTESWERQACRIANRNLSQDEWNRWVGPTLPYDRYGRVCTP